MCHVLHEMVTRTNSEKMANFQVFGAPRHLQKSLLDSKVTSGARPSGLRSASASPGAWPGLRRIARQGIALGRVTYRGGCLDRVCGERALPRPSKLLARLTAQAPRKARPPRLTGTAEVLADLAREAYQYLEPNDLTSSLKPWLGNPSWVCTLS